MKKQWIMRLAAAMAIIMTPVLSQAAQFVVVGPRALGMGGASVATVNDATAVYWNPAALAQFRKLDIRFPAGLALRDHVGLKDTWDRVNDIYDQFNALDFSAINELDRLLTDLEKPNTGADVDVHAAILASIPLSKSTIAISALGLGYAGMFPTIDTVNRDTTVPPSPSPPGTSIAVNNSAVTGISLITAEPAVSFATSFGDKLFVGANAKMIYAQTYVHSDYIRTGDFSNFIHNLDASETDSNKAAVDAGVLLMPVKSFSIGVVGRNLNSPKFPIQGMIAVETGAPQGVTTVLRTGEIALGRQYRAGVAWKPYKNVTFSADYDLSRNETLIPGYEDQTAAVGVELTLPREIVSFRGGAYKNTADSNSNIVYTGGLGFRIFAFRFDLALAYDFKEREGQASIDLALRF